MNVNKMLLNDLALGAAFLGSGGGGSSALEQKICESLLDDGKTVKMIEVDDLNDDALVVPVAYIGPLVVQEALPEITQFRAVIEAVKQDYQRPVTAIMCGEIGGGNAFSPMISALLTGLPLVNADLIGRAFPELYMSSLSVIPNEVPVVAYLASPSGNRYRCVCVSAAALEAACRQLCIAEGASLVMALYPMTGLQAKTVSVKGSYTKAMALGAVLREKRTLEGLKLLGLGTITQISKKIEQGFLVGFCMVEDSEASYKISFKNEYLQVIDQVGSCVGQSPDIIALMDVETGVPLMTEYLKIGQKVVLYHYPADPLWYTPKGLQVSQFLL